MNFLRPVKGNRMFYRQLTCALILFCCIGYGIFISFNEKRVRENARHRVQDHVKIITESLWNFDPRLISSYLSLACESEGYESITVYDHNGNIFFMAVPESVRNIEPGLIRAGLVPLINIKSDIFYGNRYIGRIEAVWKCRTIYLYTYILFILMMVVIVFWLCMRLLYAGHILKDRVRERTRELAASNASLQQEIAGRIRVENALRQSEARYRTLFEESPISLWVEDFSEVKQYIDRLKNSGIRDFRQFFIENPEEARKCAKMIHITDVNRHTLELYEASSKEELLGSIDRVLSENSFEKLVDELTAVAEDRMFEFEGLNRTLTGKEINVLIKSSIPHDCGNTWNQVFLSIHDLTRRIRSEKEKLRLEAQLRQAGKMEAMGTLAGGIAHDFNNILSAILGYTELAMGSTEDGTPLHKHLSRILKAGNRARDLVRHILTFSRQEQQELKPTRIGPVVGEALKLLRASIPTTIDIRYRTDDGNTTVMADATQIHQVLMNLCTNAGHAMEEGGGILEICLRQVSMDDTLRNLHPDIRSRRLVRLTVSDTGCGMTPDVMERIFDPFFTTKSRGKGTGMGLAVVHGIVRNHGGVLNVQSEPGKGTVFDIYLPVVNDEIPVEEVVDLLPPTGTEHVLFVDDEIFQVEMWKDALNRFGYTVTGCSSSPEAMELFRQTPERFDLVITDMTMPRMTGDELARAIIAIRPDIPVIICSGYSERLTETWADEIGIRRILMKPVAFSEAARIIRQVLDQ